MGSDRDQRNVFDFLFEHFKSGAPFTKAELFGVTSWEGQTPATYWSKHLRFFVEKVNGAYRLTEAFRPYADWERFQQHVTQVRNVSSDYVRKTYNIVRIYEFLLPLTHERHLRDTLDAIFYRDTVEARLKTIPAATLLGKFERIEGETDSAYIDRVCKWVSDHLGGYSIYHVDGRFRAEDLETKAEAVNSRYLVDETTAVTRFIFPCDNSIEAELVEFFFEHLFVKAIIEVVNGEDQIWMIETGYRNNLHIWRVPKQP